MSENRDGVCEQALKVEMYVSYLPLMRYFVAYLFINRRNFFQDGVHMRLGQASQAEAADFYRYQKRIFGPVFASIESLFCPENARDKRRARDVFICIVRIKCILTMISGRGPVVTLALTGNTQCPKSQTCFPAVWL